MEASCEYCDHAALDLEGKTSDAKIDAKRDRYPCCIVWSPLPMITWLLPVVGHMGICDEDGIIYDFAGPYHIGEDRMAFGHATRYLQLDPKLIQGMGWNEAVQKGNADYSKRMHNICCDNCHSHVGRCLAYMKYNGSASWNMIQLGAWVFFSGTWVSFGRFLETWLPFCVILFLWQWIF